MTDLCWECQRNNEALYRSANLPDSMKSAKVQQQEQHLTLVQQERSLYDTMAQDAKLTVAASAITTLSQHEPCSNDFCMHYSFDFAQQVHYPSSPLQPGPMYFLVPRKCGIFGVCCEISARPDNKHRKKLSFIVHYTAACILHNITSLCFFLSSRLRDEYASWCN